MDYTDLAVIMTACVYVGGFIVVVAKEICNG